MGESSVESRVLPIVICRPKNPTLAWKLRRSTWVKGLARGKSLSPRSGALMRSFAIDARVAGGSPVPYQQSLRT